MKKPHIFYCEDDWEFFRSGFIKQSKFLLEQFTNVRMFGIRARDDPNLLMWDVSTQTFSSVPFFFYDAARAPEYFSYPFNPGMRRLEDYKRLGPYAPIRYEPDISFAFKRRGFRMAGLEIPAVRHIGRDRHVDDPFQPLRRRGLFQRLNTTYG